MSLSLSKENKKTNYKEQQHFIHRRSKEFFLGRMAAIWHDWFVNFKLLLGFKIFKLSFGVFQMQNIRPEDCHALRGGCRRFCMNFKDFKDSRIQGFEDAGKRTASLTPAKARQLYWNKSLRLGMKIRKYLVF